MIEKIHLLLIATSALALVMGLAFFILARRPPSSPVLRRCGIALLILGAAVAALSTRNVAPAYLSIVAANTLAAAALVVFFSATRHLEKRQPPRQDYTGWLLVVLIAMLFAWYTYPAPDMASRIVLMNGVAAFLTARIALNLTRYALGPRGATVPMVLAGMLWFLTVVLAITASFTAISGEPSQDLFNPSVPVATMLAVNPLLVLLIPLAGFFVVRRGQHLDSRRFAHQTNEVTKVERHAFMTRCDALAAQALNGGQPLVFAMLDVDDFKNTTQRHGIPVANQIMKWVEEQIIGSLRVEDVLVRYSIDRYAILMPHMDQEKALLTLDSLRKRIEVGTCTIDGVPIKTTISVGVARLQPGRTTANELVSASQVAIYRARAKGRNSIAAAGDNPAAFGLTAMGSEH